MSSRCRLPSLREMNGRESTLSSEATDLATTLGGHGRISPGEGEGCAAAPSWPLSGVVGHHPRDATVASPRQPASGPAFLFARWEASHTEMATHVSPEKVHYLLAAFHSKIRASLFLLTFQSNIRGDKPDSHRLTQKMIRGIKRNFTFWENTGQPLQDPYP